MKHRLLLPFAFLSLVAYYTVAVLASNQFFLSGTTELVSVSSNGTQGNNNSAYFYEPRLSANGRYVIFESEASNLVSGDNDSFRDSFWHDRLLNITEMMPSGDGINSLPDVSDDGRFVVFSGGDNLIPDDTNGYGDIFLYDRELDDIVLVSRRSDGGLANDWSTEPIISGDGRYVSFLTFADNLIDGVNTSGNTLIYDRLLDTLTIGSLAYNGEMGGSSTNARISDNGKFVMFSSNRSDVVPDDTNGVHDVFIHDRYTGAVERIVSSTGEEGNDNTYDLDISADGRFVLFWTRATNLIADGVGQLLLYDRETKEIEIVSRNTAGELASGGSTLFTASISATGRYVAFSTSDDNLVDNDTNLVADVFIRDRELGWTELVSVNVMGTVGSSGSGRTSI